MIRKGSILSDRIKRGVWKVLEDPHEWFVLVGDRLVLAGFLTFTFSISTIALLVSGIIRIRNTTQMLYLFQALAGGNLTLITIVISINQLVLSRELKTPGELHDQIRDVMSYRNHVEATTHRSSVPVTPADFLLTLLNGTQETAEQLRNITAELDHDQLREEVESLVSDISSNADDISDTLDRSQKGIFSALAVTLQTNYSHEINEAHRLQTVYTDELPPTAHETFDELIHSLEQIDIARQYFKSIYMQSELARLSRILLYVGVLAVGSGLLMLMIYASVPEPPVQVQYLNLFVPLVVILGFSPLAILFSFVLRIATVAQRTVAITPFTTPTQEERDG